MRGWVRVLRGEVEAGVHQAETALETLKSVPSRQFHLPIRIAIVGRAKAAAGDIDGALALFNSALQAALSTGERWYGSEILRLKAEMLPRPQLQQPASAAQRCLTEAISIAQKQEAKFWELRAAMALAQLRARLGRRVEARELLVPVYGWFTEGFDTVDLKEAKELVDEFGVTSGYGTSRHFAATPDVAPLWTEADIKSAGKTGCIGRE